MIKKKLFFFFAIIFIIVALTSHISAHLLPQDKEIIAGVPANFPPQYSIDEKTGKPKGFAIDIMEEIARRTGLTMRYVVFESWPQTMQAFRDGQILLIPNAGITQDRLAYIDFTSPIEVFHISIFVRSSTMNIKKLDDLKNKQVSVVEGNKGLYLMQDYGKAKLKTHNSLEEALLALLSGITDALVYPEPPITLITQKTGIEDRVKVIGKPLLEVKRAIAVQKEHKELLNHLEAAVHSLVKDPVYNELYSKWYGKPVPFWNITRLIIVNAVIFCAGIIIFILWRYKLIQMLSIKQEQIIAERSKELGQKNILLLQEIENRKKKERDLRRSEKRLKEAQHLGKIGNWELDLSANTLFWSEEIFKIFEIDSDRFDATYEAFLEMVHPDDRERVNKAYTDSLKNRKPYEVIHRLLFPDGKIKYVQERGQSYYDENGKAVSSFGTVQDITSLQEAEAKKQKETERTQFLLDMHLKSFSLAEREVHNYALEKAVQITDSKIGYLHLVNEDQQTISLTAWNREALKDCTAVFEKHYPLETAGIWADSIRNKKPVIHNDYQNMAGKKGYPQGHSHLVRHMSIPVVENKQVRLVFGVGNKDRDYDDNDVKMLQIIANELHKVLVRRHGLEEKDALTLQLQQAQKREAVGTLASGIAHDFNNLLTVILGYSEIAKEDLPQNSPLAKNLNQVITAGNRATDLVKQILTFSRTSPEEIIPVQPHLVIKEALRMLRSTIPTTIEIWQDIENCGSINADVTQLHQVVVNLCTNAYHAMRPKGGILKVSLKPIEITKKCE